MERLTHLNRNTRTNSGLRPGRSARVPAWLSVFVLLTLLLAGVFGSTGSVTVRAAAPAGSAASSGPAAPTNYRFPAYLAEWGVYYPDYVPADIPVTSISHINYSFINPAPVTVNNQTMYECAVYDTWAAEQKPLQRLVPGTNSNIGENLGIINQLKVLRRNNPNVTMMMSIGGYSLSSNFRNIALTAPQRTHFVDSCVTFMQNKGFNGIDVDWEYPLASDRDNFTALLQEFRTKLNTLGQSTGKTYPLTIAGGPANHMDGYNIPAIASLLDFINVMTYDYGGGFDNITSHNSPLCAAANDPHGSQWNGAGAVPAYISAGMPAGKLNLGMAYYGRAMQHLQNAGPDPSFPGRFAPITPGDYVKGTWDDPDPANPKPQSEWSGVFSYWDIRDRFTGPFQTSVTPISGVNGYTRYWDSQQMLPFVFRSDAVGTSGSGVWLTYDDP